MNEKAIDLNVLPTEELKRLYELFVDGEYLTLEALELALGVARWVVAWIDARGKDDGDTDDVLVFGGADAAEAEMCRIATELYSVAAYDDKAVQKSAIGTWVVIAAVKAVLTRLARELEANGNSALADMIRSVLDLL